MLGGVDLASMVGWSFDSAWTWDVTDATLGTSAGGTAGLLLTAHNNASEEMLQVDVDATVKEQHGSKIWDVQNAVDAGLTLRVHMNKFQEMKDSSDELTHIQVTPKTSAGEWSDSESPIWGDVAVSWDTVSASVRGLRWALDLDGGSKDTNRAKVAAHVSQRIKHDVA
jgi:hypothetical protein